MKNTNIKQINMDDWVLFSDRKNSTNYHSKDLKWLLKVSTNEEESIDDLMEERDASKNAISLGIPTPFVKDVVVLPDGKYGIIYEYIKDKVSLARAISLDLENIDKYIEKFSNIGNKIHSIKCDKNKYKNIEERIREGLEKFNIYTDDEKQLLYKKMDEIEKKDTFLHVDYQTGNVITSSKGEYAIDIGLMSYGNPVYDFAIYYLFSKLFVDDQKADTFFHIDKKSSIKCWDTFVKYQFGIEDTKNREKLEEELAPISILTFTAHLPQIPCVEVHTEVKKLFFNKYFKK